MFQGAVSLNLDAKGRLMVPTKHRDGLQAGNGGKLVLTAHPHKCLLLYPLAGWEPIRARIMSFPSFDPQLALWKRLLIGYAEELELDGAGRLLISPALRRFAALEKELMLVGQGGHFELWSQTAWEQQLEKLGSSPDKLPPGMENFSL